MHYIYQTAQLGYLGHALFRFLSELKGMEDISLFFLTI